MKLFRLAAGLGATWLLVAASPDRPETPPEDPPARPVATVDLAPRGGGRTSGEVSFTQAGDAILVTVKVRGASPGDHDVGLAASAECGAPDARFGSLGPLRVGSEGEGRLTQRLTARSVGTRDLLGHAFVVMAHDDTVGRGVGNAPVACGVVEAAGRLAH